MRQGATCTLQQKVQCIPPCCHPAPSAPPSVSMAVRGRATHSSMVPCVRLCVSVRPPAAHSLLFLVAARRAAACCLSAAPRRRPARAPICVPVHEQPRPVPPPTNPPTHTSPSAYLCASQNPPSITSPLVIGSSRRLALPSRMFHTKYATHGLLIDTKGRLVLPFRIAPSISCPAAPAPFTRSSMAAGPARRAPRLARAARQHRRRRRFPRGPRLPGGA